MDKLIIKFTMYITSMNLPAVFNEMSHITYQPVWNNEVQLILKYVGKQVTNVLEEPLQSKTPTDTRTHSGSP